MDGRLFLGGRQGVRLDFLCDLAVTEHYECSYEINGKSA